MPATDETPQAEVEASLEANLEGGFSLKEYEDGIHVVAVNESGQTLPQGNLLCFTEDKKVYALSNVNPRLGFQLNKKGQIVVLSEPIYRELQTGSRKLGSESSQYENGVLMLVPLPSQNVIYVSFSLDGISPLVHLLAINLAQGGILPLQTGGGLGFELTAANSYLFIHYDG